jgi:hypothetical protein
MSNWGIGSQIKHPSFGPGVVVATDADFYTVYFTENEQVKSISKNFDGLEVTAYQAPAGPATVTLDDVEAALENVLWKMEKTEEIVHLGGKWMRGKVVIHPGDTDLQAKEIPIDQFFHKIVMLRDRLRVLEQNINSHAKLDDEDKVHLQQYITRCYGSLTTFNVLFRDKWHQFKGEGKGD